jgi:hypothetical protein
LGDGDNIGDGIECNLLSGHLELAARLSDNVKTALEEITLLFQERLKAELIYAGGDNICFQTTRIDQLASAVLDGMRIFQTRTGRTMSFGAGKSSVEALISLRKAKVSGKGKLILSWEG